MNNTPDSPAKPPDDHMDQGGNYWTLFTPGIWKVLHAVLEPGRQLGEVVHRQAAMALVHRLSQSVADAGADADQGCLLDAEPFGDFVSGEEAYATDVARQA